jgi:hypothetical protein
VQTLAELESTIKETCGLAHETIEFAALCQSTREICAVAPTRRASEFLDGDLQLLVQRPTRPAVAPAPAPGPGEITVAFTILKPISKNFSLNFPKTETMRTCRERVAEGLNLTVDDITVIFAGKPFKDEFVLGRLRVGSHALTVYVPPRTDILLLSYRSP